MQIPDWLVTQPIAHRGLHDEAGGIIENTLPAFEAAISAGYAIETDLRYTGDGIPVIFHDDTLNRVTVGNGRISDYSASELKKTQFRATEEKMMDLEEFLRIINGRTPLLIELKNLKDESLEFPARVGKILQAYHGPYALISFDPRMINVIQEQFPNIVRGLISCGFPKHYWPEFSPLTRFKLRHLYYTLFVKPHFIAYGVDSLSGPAPRIFRKLRGPVLTWTVKTDENLTRARRYADNIIFEKLRP